MPFEKVQTQVDFPAQERAILDFWQRHRIFDQLREKNRQGPTWSFLDGPITANNPMGVHHAWGRTYKDAYQRYHAMLGHHLRYQNGFDCQGLWVEVEVEKELKLRSKRDIENLVPGDTFASIDRFVTLCKERVDKFARIQAEQSVRLGYWMDWDRDEDWAKEPGQRRSYFTMSAENNYTIWHFLKRCHQRGLIYRGYDAMPWCPRCSVGLSQMEMADGYMMVAHRAVFVRFPLRDRPGESLLVWTTTPWTLSSNVAAAVNPTLTYLKVLHRGHVYYLARGAFSHQRLEEEFKRKEWVEGVPKLESLEQIFKKRGGFDIVGTIAGADMVGWSYDGPFDELPAQQHAHGYPEEIARVVSKQNWASEKPAREVHRVIAWKEVGETEGTGIVHIAPGCGKEDFLLGRDQEKLPPIAPLDEFGCFLPGFGPLEGKAAVDHATTDFILANLKEKGLLLEVEKYPHKYPHCWRCKTELLFRLVDEWFINMSWRDEIMRVVEQVTFLPESINGKARELDWLRNMGDWMISKKRFWGLALPIWVDDETGEFEVLGSYEELKARAVEGWNDFDGHSPHRPWIDKVKIRNPNTGNLMSRILDVGNPWLDAGIVPYSTLGYNTDRAEWSRWFPADLITECFPGQFKNWFYAILAMSTMLEQRPPFKVLLGHGLVRDQWGEEMHKSKGNSIAFGGAADGEPIEGHDRPGYVIKHELKTGEQPIVPGALSVNVVEEVRDGKKLKVALASCPPISADLMRWLYCRTNPATNINFGPGPADELRSKFILKLWHTYAFFCDNARQEEGGFLLTGDPIPIATCTDMDRWILSDLQKLVQTARHAFEHFDVGIFCLEAERYLDDKLSNWYIRRSKRRFWEGEQTAYQTLYTILTTLTKLFAPVIPFLTEAMFQNLRRDTDPLSVHLCEYPTVDEALFDEQLSQDMEALARIVTLGSAARNAVKIKVRQPLAELKVRPTPDDEGARRAVDRFPDLICEELNLKRVTLVPASDPPLLQVEIKPNLKTLGSKFGQHLNEVVMGIAALDPATVAALVQAGRSFGLEVPAHADITLFPEDVLLQFKAPTGWAGAEEKGTQVLLDTTISEALAHEGLAREVVRYVNAERKNAHLQIEDRIELWLDASSDVLRRAIDTHRAYIAAETLVSLWAKQSPDNGCHRASIKLDKDSLTIALRKV